MHLRVDMPVKLDRILEERFHALKLKQMIRFKRVGEGRTYE